MGGMPNSVQVYLKSYIPYVKEKKRRKNGRKEGREGGKKGKKSNLLNPDGGDSGVHCYSVSSPYV